MRKAYFLITILTAVQLLTSCQKEQVFCCNPQTNEWINSNLVEIRQMSRNTWKTLPEDLKNPVFGAFTPQQKISFWTERLDSILTLDWNSLERKHILNLDSLIQKNPDWFDVENRTEDVEDRMSISAFSWITYAKEKLKWDNKIIGSIVASGNKLINKEGLLEINTYTYDIELASSEEVDCNCNQTYNFCEGNEPCKDDACSEVPYCGWLLLSICDGLCGPL